MWTEEKLNEMLTTPSAKLIDDVKKIKGDRIVNMGLSTEDGNIVNVSQITTLVVPKKHYENMLDVDGETLNHVMNTVTKLSRHYVDNCGFTGVNILNNSGVDALQSVMHLHIHISPYWLHTIYLLFLRVFLILFLVFHSRLLIILYFLR